MSSQASASPPPSIPKPIRFLFGGLAGMSATCFVQPLDLIKNRMQLSGEGGGTRDHKTSLHAIRNIVHKEGLSGLYVGLTAGLLRQATYATVRMGIYNSLLEHFSREDGKPVAFLAKVSMAISAGAVAALFGTPAEIALIRMTSDGRLPVAERRCYKNAFDAIIRMAREEGILTLWRGCIPTVGRAMVTNAAQLASYSQSKEMLLSTPYFSDNIVCHFVASMISGFVTTTASLPLDMAKTRIQNMKYINGKPEYKGAIDVITRVVRKEGFFSLWKGFTPYYGRIGPHTVLLFIFLEQMNAAYIRLYLQRADK